MRVGERGFPYDTRPRSAARRRLEARDRGNPRQPRGPPRSAGAASLKQVHEGYGPGEAAVWVDCLTDDPQRTSAAVRDAFLRHGGLPGAPGSVGYLFREVGRLVFPADSQSDALARLARETGAEDVMTGRCGVVEILTDPLEVEAVRTALERSGFVPTINEVTRRAAATIKLEGSAAMEMRALLGELRRIDGVGRIYTNAEVAGELLESV